MVRIQNNWKFETLPGVNIGEITELSQLNVDLATAESVTIPHTWYKDGNAYEGSVVYRTKFKVSFGDEQRVFLNFEGADRWCRVFVNEKYVGEHKGGYSAFTFEITEFCNTNGENSFTVLLDNRSWEIISPLAGDFTVFGGLYRNVNLVVTEKMCFDRTYYGTEGVIVCTDTVNDNGIVNVEPHVLGDTEDVTIRYTIRNHAGDEVLFKETKVCEKEVLTTECPVLWNSKENPYLYSLRAELVYAGTVVDMVEKTIGFRKAEIDSETGFCLNGTHVRLHGVAKHQDNAEVYNATNEEHRKQDLQEILEIGANAVRLSHYQHPQNMYDLCDENGLVVWAEIPFLKINPVQACYDNACTQLKELILQNMHHVSICFWGVQNEIAMFAEDETTYAYVTGLNELVKSLDTTRISAGANLFCVKNDSKLNRITDAIGYNIYFGWYYGEMKDNEAFVENFHKDNPRIPFGITEYGVDCNTAYHNDSPKVKDYSEDFQALYHETVYPIFASKPYIWGTFVWNMFDFSSGIRDEGGIKYKNCKGLVTYDRKTKKDAFYYYKAQWSDVPFVAIAGKRYVNHMIGDTKFKVYSNLNSVTLYVENYAGKFAYTKQSDTGVFFFDGITVTLGENTLRAVGGEQEDILVIRGCEEKDPSYTFVDPNPGLNVKNWFLDALEEEKMFPKGMFSIRDSSADLVASEAAMKVIEEFSAELAEGMRSRKGSMPMERILYYMRKQFTDEDCKELNSRLTKVKK